MYVCILVRAWYIMSRQLNVCGNNAGGAYVGLLNALLCMYPLILIRIYIYLSEYNTHHALCLNCVEDVWPVCHCHSSGWYLAGS